MVTLNQAAEKIIKECMDVKKDEIVLIITDSEKEKIANSIFEAAKKITSKVQMIEIPIGKRHGEEPLPEIAEEMKNFDVIIIPTTKSLSHTKARRDASKAGARIATMPGITEEVLVRTMEADYNKIKERTDKIVNVLDNAKEVEVITEKGTNIKMNIEGRKCARGGGLLHNKGDFGNLPAGEACLAPVEGTTNGVFIIDASWGKLDADIKIKVENGYAVSIEGGEKAKELKQTLDKVGKEAYNIAELGIGTNDKAIVTGNVLEDEKVLGTAHIALGNNITYGGKIDVPIHLDGIFYKPTIIIDGKKIMEKGELLLNKL